MAASLKVRGNDIGYVDEVCIHGIMENTSRYSSPVTSPSDSMGNSVVTGSALSV